MNGLLVIDKPSGMTSRDVVNRIQKWFPRKTKIGHTGTLDPLATGVLVVCIGAATRLVDFVQAMGKTYLSRFRLGATSATDDADGTITVNETTVPPSREQIELAIPAFLGLVEQVPPAFSALKVSGQRAHNLARSGMEVTLAARTIRIDAIRIQSYEWPFLDVEIDCGKGTYIRSIARDLGNSLGCGGMVQTLRRTRIGPFTADQGTGLDVDPSQITLLPLSAAVTDLPRVRLNSEDAKRFRQGQCLRLAASLGSLLLTDGSTLVVSDESESLIGIAIAVQNVIRPDIVFNM